MPPRRKTSFCTSALDWALQQGQPEIFNTDQGAQFTSEAFTSRLEKHGVEISMDGRGRAMDNIFIERLRRTLKYEEIFLHDYANVGELIAALKRYFRFYNSRTSASVPGKSNTGSSLLRAAQEGRVSGCGFPQRKKKEQKERKGRSRSRGNQARRPSAKSS